ncbi:nuclear transport factor 2 family protein [Alteromonas sp. M12]|uniref:YybH family protein n=1 Tax=Alteromonas sp. M12 TaxID=3135644 RepID=UPI00319E42BD|tara:strand:- start:428 stop:916 length:489 start_codon:yes stop_codon:yes gene_type:complete
MSIKHLSITTIVVLILSSVSSFAAYAHGEAKQEKKNELFVGTQSEAAKAVSAFHQALRSGDKKTARKMLADDVIIFEGGGIERSAEEYANHHMLSDMKYLAAIESKKLEHQVFISGDMAYSISRSKTSGTYKDKKVDYTGMETMTLKSTDSGWKITHIHWSK